MKKYIRVFLLCLLMTLMLVPSTAFADTEEKSDTWGDNLTWELDEDGTLTISGTGAMNDFSMDPDANRTAWKQFRLEIKKVVIKGLYCNSGGQA